jgi:hypothetical protein
MTENKLEKPFISYLLDHEVVLEEPWCNLRSGTELENWGKEEEITWNQTHRRSEKYQFYVRAFDFISDAKLTCSLY